jgi:hypothetical protein
LLTIGENKNTSNSSRVQNRDELIICVCVCEKRAFIHSNHTKIAKITTTNLLKEASFFAIGP